MTEKRKLQTANPVFGKAMTQNLSNDSLVALSQLQLRLAKSRQAEGNVAEQTYQATYTDEAYGEDAVGVRG